MKTTSRFSGKLVATAIAVLSVFSFTACTADYFDDDQTGGGNVNYTISGNASGSQVVPAVTGTGSATISGTYNAGTNTLTYTTTWTGLTGAPTSGAFYTGASGQAGTMVGSAWNLGVNPAAAGTFSSQATLTDAQEADLLAGNWYYSFGTVANAGGEVRGQITATQ